MEEYIQPEIDNKNLAEHIYYLGLRDALNIPKQIHSMVVGRITEIPIYSYTRLLKYEEHIGIDGVHYNVRYSYKGNIKDKLITQKRFIKAYNKWFKKCWIEQIKDGNDDR